MQTSVFRQFMEWLVPAIITDEIERGQATVLLIVYLISIPAAVGLLVFVLNTPMDPGLRSIAVNMSVFTVICYCIGMAYFMRFANFTVGVTLYSITASLSILFLSLMTGGFSNSPHLLTIFVIPVWSFLFLGGFHGLLWSLMVGLIIVIAYALEASGVQLGQIVSPEDYATFTMQSMLSTLSLIAVCLYTYDTGFRALGTRLREERSKFAYEALHDSLTGLSNRKLFYKRAKEAIEQSLESDRKAAILYFDLDKFKEINDTRGHDVGDTVLKEVAMRLQSVVRSSDTVARLGGDEFAIILLAMAGKGTEKIISEKIMEQLKHPVVIEGQSYTISGSLGVSVCPDDSTQLDKLIKSADEAMYAAKKNHSRICYAQDLKGHR